MKFPTLEGVVDGVKNSLLGGAVVFGLGGLTVGCGEVGGNNSSGVSVSDYQALQRKVEELERQAYGEVELDSEVKSWTGEREGVTYGDNPFGEMIGSKDEVIEESGGGFRYEEIFAPMLDNMDEGDREEFYSFMSFEFPEYSPEQMNESGFIVFLENAYDEFTSEGVNLSLINREDMDRRIRGLYEGVKNSEPVQIHLKAETSKLSLEDIRRLDNICGEVMNEISIVGQNYLDGEITLDKYVEYTGEYNRVLELTIERNIEAIRKEYPKYLED